MTDELGKKLLTELTRIADALEKLVLCTSNGVVHTTTEITNAVPIPITTDAEDYLNVSISGSVCVEE